MLSGIRLSRSIGSKSKFNSPSLLQPRQRLQLSPRSLYSTQSHSQSHSHSQAILNHPILIVYNPIHHRSKLALKFISHYLSNLVPNTPLIIHHPTQIPPPPAHLVNVKLVIALGGDGTILHVSHLFNNSPCPPILGFNLGTIGFLLPFPPRDFEIVIRRVLDGQIGTEQRMRLDCLVADPVHPNSLIRRSAMNEITLHRSHSPHLTSITIALDGLPLTETVADGLILATPAGSTAYSSSAGGPILVPGLDAILLTPICPRSLSFRPLVLPPDLPITLTLDQASRAPADLALDGSSIKPIQPGESITIARSKHPISLFSPTPTSASLKVNQTWIANINEMLNFNRPYHGR